jgi:SNF2 family DNA or RNA helicase
MLYPPPQTQGVRMIINMTSEEKQARAKENQAALEEILASGPKKIQEYYRHVPKSMQMTFLRAHAEKRPSFPKAIKLKCLDCCCWEKEEVKKCTVQQCGLWRLRPYK